MSFLAALSVALLFNINGSYQNTAPYGTNLPVYSGQARRDQNYTARFRRRFIQLCDLAVGKIQGTKNKDPFFIDSYAVRALCVAYDMTGDPKYLDACKSWSERMIETQDEMIPAGAYYINYGRTPGQNKGDWYVADCSSIAMGVLSTAVRCKGPDRARLLGSVEKFWSMVSRKFVRPSGGVTDGYWPKYNRAWWCSSSLFGSLSFMLYANTGNSKYLRTGLGIIDWLNKLDLKRVGPLPLSEQGPSMPMYVMEACSSGWPYIIRSVARKRAAIKQVSRCLNWTARQQQMPISKRKWVISGWWGAKYAGLPFHQYIFSHYLPSHRALAVAADREMRRLARYVFAGRPEVTQLATFMMLSYAERLDPGAIYRSIGKKP